MNKVKDFFENHKTGIAVATSLIAGVAIGGTAMYVKHGKYRELEKLLDKYTTKVGGMNLTEKLARFLKDGPVVFELHGYAHDTVASVTDVATDILKIYDKEGQNINDKLIGTMIFTKPE